jgi:tetratricopeptide (TPR) repeat protein
LGNLLYDWQPGEATRLWEASVALDPSFSISHRNLAVAYSHNPLGKDLDKAIAELEKAVLCQPTYAAHFKELADLYEQTGTPMEKRLEVIEKSAQVVAQRDDAQYRAIAIKVALGKYDDAIQMMTGRHFASSEGGNIDVGQHWTEAHILRGRQFIAEKRFTEALADFQAAVLLPANLPGGGGPGGGARRVEIAYWTGIAYEGMGDSVKAAASWTNGTKPAPAGADDRRGGGGRGAGGRGGRGGGGGGGGASAESYYQALCYQKLGDAEKARTLFQNLVESGQTLLDQPQAAPAEGRGGGRGGRGEPPQPPGARIASAHYTLGLGYLGLDDLEKAKAEFSQAVSLDPDLVGARTALASIK